jgi:hypothetical protein
MMEAADHRRLDDPALVEALERSRLTDIDADARSTTREEDRHPLAHQRVERVRHAQGI